MSATSVAFISSATIAFASTTRIFELLALAPSVQDVADAQVLPKARGEIVLEGLWFQYPTGEAVIAPRLPLGGVKPPLPGASETSKGQPRLTSTLSIRSPSRSITSNR